MSLATSHPRSQIVGIEYKRKRFEKLIPRALRLGLKNLILLYGKAEEVIPLVFFPTSISLIYINFPDPWPKRRHNRRRLVTAPFLRLLFSRLKTTGQIHLVTDHHDYGQEIVSAATEAGISCRLRRLSREEAAYSAYAVSLYEQKSRAAGRELFKFTALPRIQSKNS